MWSSVCLLNSLQGLVVYMDIKLHNAANQQDTNPAIGGCWMLVESAFANHLVIEKRNVIKADAAEGNITKKASTQWPEG